jgi:tRNA dimethylallyltransferase
MKPLLIVVTGPTGSGKTALSIELARALHCDIISADSRQLFRDIPIGTAAPSAGELAAAVHHFIGTLALDEYYSAARYEEDVMALLPRLFERDGCAVMCGGSMMYVDAVCRGIDDLPTVSEQVRADTLALYEREGLDGLRATLRNIDPDYLAQADLSNHRRLIHAIEITIEAGRPYSSLRVGAVKERPFRVVKMMIDYPREELFDRINRRVDKMMAEGLLDEARRVYPLRSYNSLNTVGYKEMFAYLDGTMDLPTAVARMAKNTRVYAKKQLTWLKRDTDIVRLDPHAPLLPQALKAINNIAE